VDFCRASGLILPLKPLKLTQKLDSGRMQQPAGLRQTGRKVRMHMSIESLLGYKGENPWRAISQANGGDEWAQYTCRGADSDDKTTKRHRQADTGETGVRRGGLGHRKVGGLPIGLP